MRRIQFSLTTLLILPLVISPLLIAIRECRNIASNHQRELGVATVLLGFLYVLALTLVDCANRPAANDQRLSRAAIRGAIRGGLFGILYYMLIFLPIAAADQYYIYWSQPWTVRVSDFAALLGSTVFIGLFAGAPIGGAIGFVVGMFRATRSRSAPTATDSLTTTDGANT
jgi:hypothetical protein